MRFLCHFQWWHMAASLLAKGPRQLRQVADLEPLDRRDYQSHLSGWAHVGTKVEKECEGNEPRTKCGKRRHLRSWQKSTQPLRLRKITARKGSTEQLTVVPWKLQKGRAVSQFSLCPQGLAHSEHQEKCVLSVSRWGVLRRKQWSTPAKAA